MGRRIAALLLLLGMLPLSARADALCVIAPQAAALTDEAGNVLLDGFETAFAVREGELYAAGKRGEYRLYDSGGNPLGDIAFSMIEDAGDALVYRVGKGYGAMDAAGAPLLAPEWTQLTTDGEGGWLALDGDPLDDAGDEIIHLDAEGTAQRTGVYTASGLAPVRCGRMPYMAANGRWGAVDGGGRRAIAPAWRALGRFENGLAKATGPEGMGLVDAEGREIVAPVYDWLERCPAMWVGHAEDHLDVFAPDGSLRFALPGERLEAALAGNRLAVFDGSSTRLYAPDGALLAEDAGRVDYAPGVGGQVIAIDGSWGEACQRLIDPDGSVASGRVQQLLPLTEGRYAFLEMDGIEYYSAELGAMQRSWNYATMRYGLMDGAGRVLLPAEYSEIRAVGADRLLLISGEAATLCDLDGNAIRAWITAEAEAPSAEAGA